MAAVLCVAVSVEVLVPVVLVSVVFAPVVVLVALSTVAGVIVVLVVMPVVVALYHDHDRVSFLMMSSAASGFRTLGREGEKGGDDKSENERSERAHENLR